MNGMSVTEWSVDQEKNQKEVQISKGENVNPVISVDDSEGRTLMSRGVAGQGPRVVCERFWKIRCMLRFAQQGVKRPVEQQVVLGVL